MRRPNDVVSKHHKRAVALWMLLIFGILAYTCWLFAAVIKKRENPSTSLVLSNTVYTYPDMWVCPYNDYGCDTRDLEKKCVASSNLTDGGAAIATFYPGGQYQQEVAGVDKWTPTRGWCWEFKTSKVDNFVGQERVDVRTEDLAYITVKASWYPGGGPGASTTCVAEEESWEAHSEWVYLSLFDPVTEEPSAGIQISYSCITNQSSSHVSSYMGIGRNEQHNIAGETAVFYKALSLTPSVYRDKVNENITHPYAHLEVHMHQEPDSWEIVTEIDPLNVGEILGSIGGFWDFILILWPIFFVAATPQDPHLKSRDFKRSVGTVAGVAGLMVTACVPGPLKRTTASEGQNGLQIDSTEHRQIEKPYWETTQTETDPVEHLVEV